MNIYLNDEQIRLELHKYWIEAKDCKACGHITGGVLALSPPERDDVIAKAAAYNAVKVIVEEIEDCVAKEYEHFKNFTAYQYKQDLIQALKELANKGG